MEDAAEMSTTSPKTADGKQTESKNNVESIRLVLQRFRCARLLIDETDVVVTGDAAASTAQDASLSLSNPKEDGSSGLLIYISFAQGATETKVLQAARTVMNVPLLTRGAWGDGSETNSVLDMAEIFREEPSKRVAVMIVPQANLISKVRSQGRSIQYHGQIDKKQGQALYKYFVQCVKVLALERQFRLQHKPIPDWLARFGNSADNVSSHTADASLPPEQLFRDTELYATWDHDGVPLTLQNGEPVTKSARKKLRKLYDAHKKRHEKYMLTLAKPNSRTSAAPCETSTTFMGDNVLPEEPDHSRWSELDPAFLHVVDGSFGKRQGLEFTSDMGPFCHVLNV